jgi:hypothetical protein
LGVEFAGVVPSSNGAQARRNGCSRLTYSF